MKIPSKLRAKLEKNKYTERFINDYAYRSLILCFCAFVINVAYAVYNAYFGAVNGSFWFVSLAVYFIILSLMRGGIILTEYLLRKKQAEDTGRRKLKIYLASGIILLLLATALSGVVIIMYKESRVFERPGLIIYVAAAYTFCKITASIVNLVKTKKRSDYSLGALRNIGLSDALVSVLTLQTALLAQFGDGGDYGAANIALGGLICVFTIGLGIYMIVGATKKLIGKGEQTDE